MSRLLRVAIPLLGAAWFIGHYFNNPVPPNMEESSFYNIFVGLISILIDLVSTNLIFSFCTFHVKNGAQITRNTFHMSEKVLHY